MSSCIPVYSYGPSYIVDFLFYVYDVTNQFRHKFGTVVQSTLCRREGGVYPW